MTVTPFLLAHFSDPHLTGLQDVTKRELMNKRALGYLSWRRRRRYEHRREILAALITDVRRMAPDHTVVTGDMTHLGTVGEFREVADWLREVGQPEDVTVVPGNHDTYVSERWDRTFGLWLPYMASDGQESTTPTDNPADLFPSLRIRGNIALIGANSARPSAPLLAVGSLGRKQLRALAQVLEETGHRGLCRVLLIHHPPVPGSIKWRKRLTDSRRLENVIARKGVELVLHGHGHQSACHWFETPSGNAPVIGARSASAIGIKPGRRAQYHLYRIARDDGGWRVHVEVRGYVPAQNAFAPEDEWEATLPATGSQADEAHAWRA